MPSSHFGQFKKDLGLIEEHLSDSLFNPLHDFLSRPRKSFRSQLVHSGFELAGGCDPAPERLDLLGRASQMIEALHAGSLIIDDVQDESSMRRGLPALHMQIGTPLALNAGNWLYFFAYKLILESEVSESLKNQCLREVTDVLLKAHQGQALDLSVRMSQQRVVDAPLICRQSLQWKSGALLELGLVLGGIIAGCEGPRLESLRMLGRELGVTLQMFDDLGNLQLKDNSAKHLEDLILQRPSFIWWVIAEEFPEQWGLFKEAVLSLPKIEGLQFFLDAHPVMQKGRALAIGHQRKTFQTFATLGGDLTSPAFQKIEEMAERIASAYT